MSTWTICVYYVCAYGKTNNSFCNYLVPRQQLSLYWLLFTCGSTIKLFSRYLQVYEAQCVVETCSDTQVSFVVLPLCCRREGDKVCTSWMDLRFKVEDNEKKTLKLR
ncbi:unnamed protein product [Cuscuta epithymum]|uniref:Uncharacterized protein n=1 Tax=Cuscuta epithymum TaxID=186058 RepID=A0AAV0GKL8_9ASTE|nr:unnamed protein product [Cuscuta epithymum]